MPAGRPTLLTPEVLEDVRRLLPTVLYVGVVANYLGIDRLTMRRWLKRGAKELRRLRTSTARPRPKEAVYAEFCTTIKKALAEGEIHDAGVIKKASAEQWQAAAWRLERRNPGRWGKKDRVEVSGKDGKGLVAGVLILPEKESDKATDDKRPDPAAPGGAAAVPEKRG